VRVCGADAWLSRRVEAGIASMGAELDEHTIAAEAELLDRTVSFTKGCYTGQELVARLDARGNKVARHLRGLVLGPQPRDAPPVVAGSELVADDAPGAKSVGTVTSAAWSPALGCHVALGYVRRAVEPGSLLQVRTGGTAEVRTLPLVPAD
jgi:folate-binding protein YgfZ